MSNTTLTAELSARGIAPSADIIAALAGNPPMRNSRRWAQLGDSRIQNGAGAISGSSQAWTANPTEAQKLVVKRNTGVAFWAEFFSKGRMEFPVSLNFGITGDTIVNIMSTNQAGRLDVAIAAAKTAGAAGILLQMGTNDWASSADYETVRAAFQAGVQRIKDNGLRVAYIVDTPRGLSTVTGARLSAVNLRKLLRFREWAMSFYDNDPRVFIVDTFQDTADFSSTAGDWASAQECATDAVHMAPLSGSKIGRRLWLQVGRLFAGPSLFLPAANSDLYDATDNPRGIVSSNPAIVGTGGNMQSNGTGVMAPSPWTIQFSNATGYNVAFSQPTTSDPETGATKQWQQLALSGTPGTTQKYSFGQTVALGGANPVQPGTSIVQAFAEIEWDVGLTGIDEVCFGFEGARTAGPTGATTFYVMYGGLKGASGYIDPATTASGLIMTDPYLVAADITTLRMALRLGLTASVAIGGNVRIRNAGLRIVG